MMLSASRVSALRSSVGGLVCFLLLVMQYTNQKCVNEDRFVHLQLWSFKHLCLLAESLSY